MTMIKVKAVHRLIKTVLDLKVGKVAAGSVEINGLLGSARLKGLMYTVRKKKSGLNSGLALLTMNFLFILEDFELTVEAIVDTTDGGVRVGSAHNELYLYYRNS
jgi:hypothetical protein